MPRKNSGGHAQEVLEEGGKGEHEGGRFLG